MSKQEEIKKFISLYLRQRFTTDEMPEDECDAEAEFILQYLHSQDVAIQTNKGLPVTDELISWSDVDRAGYVAVKPLI